MFRTLHFSTQHEQWRLDNRNMKILMLINEIEKSHAFVVFLLAWLKNETENYSIKITAVVD